MVSDRQAETAFEAALDEFCEAVFAGAPVSVVTRLFGRYEAAFLRWAAASGADLTRSSFEQRAQTCRPSTLNGVARGDASE